MLKASDIHKRFGDLKVLKGINLEIDSREIVSIVGASGAGKSTLLHILGSLDRPNNGEISINKQRLGELKNTELARFRNNHIGFVFQFHNLLPEFTAFENIAIAGYLGDRSEKLVEERVRNLMDILGISNRKDHKPSQLSGGEQQRVAVARALVNEPAIVFADEPSGNLDSKNARDLHELFFKLREELKQTFVIVTHNQELSNMSDRKLEIVDGKIVNQEILPQ